VVSEELERWPKLPGSECSSTAAGSPSRLPGATRGRVLALGVGTSEPKARNARSLMMPSGCSAPAGIRPGLRAVAGALRAGLAGDRLGAPAEDQETMRPPGAACSDGHQLVATTDGAQRRAARQDHAGLVRELVFPGEGPAKPCAPSGPTFQRPIPSRRGSQLSVCTLKSKRLTAALDRQTPPGAAGRLAMVC